MHQTFSTLETVPSKLTLKPNWSFKQTEMALYFTVISLACPVDMVVYFYCSAAVTLSK